MGIGCGSPLSHCHPEADRVRRTGLIFLLLGDEISCIGVYTIVYAKLVGVGIHACCSDRPEIDVLLLDQHNDQWQYSRQSCMLYCGCGTRGIARILLLSSWAVQSPVHVLEDVMMSKVSEGELAQASITCAVPHRMAPRSMAGAKGVETAQNMARKVSIQDVLPLLH